MKINKNNANKPRKVTIKISKATLIRVGKNLILTSRVIDDILARWVFKNPRCVEVLVNIILKQQIRVIESLTQYNMDNAGGRLAIVDVLATTEDGKRIVIEIQRESDEWLPLRARHICSVSDANLIKKGTEFKDIHEFYTIFIMEKDPFGEGKSVYTIKRMFTDTHKVFKDRQTIIFVNAATKEEGEVKDLVEDFLMRDYKKMKNEVFRETVRLIKDSTEREDKGAMEFVTEEMRALAKQLKSQGKEEGKREGFAEGIEKGIERGIEKGIERGKKESAIEIAKQLITLGFSFEGIVAATRLPMEEVKALY